MVGMFGMGWLGWGLGTAKAFTPSRIIPFDVVGIVLLGYSIHFVIKGRSLRLRYPASSRTLAQKTNKQFTVVVILELTAIAILGAGARAFHRSDLAPALAGMVVGLHFMALGTIFRQTRFHFWGIAITLWCSVCAILLRASVLVAWNGIGTGVLLWAMCAHGLVRA